MLRESARLCAEHDFHRLFALDNSPSLADDKGNVLVWPHVDNLWIRVRLGLLLPPIRSPASTPRCILGRNRQRPPSTCERLINSVLWSVVSLVVCARSSGAADVGASPAGANVFSPDRQPAAPVWLKDALYIHRVGELPLRLAGSLDFAHGVRLRRDAACQGDPRRQPAAIARGRRNLVGGAAYGRRLLLLVALLRCSVAGCAVFLYISYAMPVAAVLFAEGGSGRASGRSGLAAVEAVRGRHRDWRRRAVPHSASEPPNDQLLWYAGGLVVLLLALWFASERRASLARRSAPRSRAVRLSCSPKNRRWASWLRLSKA